MKILFFSFSSEITASSRSRVYQYIPYLKEKGVILKVINSISTGHFYSDVSGLKISLLNKIKNSIFKVLQTIKVLINAFYYDVIVVQRVLLPIWQQRLLRFINSNVIYDFDDALYLHPRLTKRFDSMIKLSRHIVLENMDNFNYAKNFNNNISIITGPIDTDRYFPIAKKENNTVVVIGWIGSPSTAKYLNVLYGVFKELKGKYREGLAIKIISSKKIDLDNIPHTFVEWSLDSEVRELQSFDIGIMPLEDDQWCRGKGGYKLLQYMSVGIPCVASPTGINKEIIEEGITGFLAANSNEWLKKISILVENKALREKIGAAGRKKRKIYIPIR